MGTRLVYLNGAEVVVDADDVDKLIAAGFARPGSKAAAAATGDAGTTKAPAKKAPAKKAPAKKAAAKGTTVVKTSDLANPAADAADSK